MAATITIEIPADSEPLVRRVLALQEELNTLALTAPDGTVFDACEAAVVQRGRDLPLHILTDAVARRVEAAEKKGRRSASAPAVEPRRIGVPSLGNSSAPSASSR
jgi:hypothetical protein